MTDSLLSCFHEQHTEFSYPSCFRLPIWMFPKFLIMRLTGNYVYLISSG